MPQRINLDVEHTGRQAIDADWTPKKKAIVAGTCVALAAGVLSAGVWYMVSSAPPRLPRTANEAITVLASDKIDRLDEDRKREYVEEAARLVNTLSWEERSKLHEDENTREAMRALREAQFDETARRVARGESMEDIWASMRPQGERPEMTEEQRERMREMRERQRNMTEEERREQMKERREQMNERMAQQFNGGNAQNMGLRMEMFGRMSRMGGGRWGRGGGGGGGRGGGGGGRGGN